MLSHFRANAQIMRFFRRPMLHFLGMAAVFFAGYAAGIRRRLRLCARFTARIRLRSPAIARWAIRRARFWGGCDGKVIDLKSLSNLRIYHTNISILSQMCLNARGLDDIIVLFL